MKRDHDRVDDPGVGLKRAAMGGVAGLFVLLLALVAAQAAAQCYGGNCGSVHKPGDVSWSDALLSNAGFGEGPPCSSCHTTSKMVPRPDPETLPPARYNFPQKMPRRQYQQFHQQAVRVIRGRGPLETLPEARVKAEFREQYQWVLESLEPQGRRPPRDR